MSTTVGPRAKSSRRRVSIPVTLVVALLVGILGAMGAAPVSATVCEIPWGSLPKASADQSTGAVTGVRTASHTCFDRFVIDVNGNRAGYRVEYVDALSAGGPGEIIPVEGGAVLRIIAVAPSTDEFGSATFDPADITATDLDGHRTLRDVQFAFSFEGRTTIGLGVRARLPFRVFTLDGPGDASRIVVDVAHFWYGASPIDVPSPPRAERTYAVMGVAHDDVLNIRSAAGVNNRIVATASPTDEVVATGRTRMLSRSLWYQVTVDGTTGWASARYLGATGPTVDDTSSFLNQYPRPTATTMAELGAEVAARNVSTESGSRIVMSVAPTVGDLGEVTYDVIGLGDDSIHGVRLHIFAEPLESGDGFELRSIEATLFCARGGGGGGECV